MPKGQPTHHMTADELRVWNSIAHLKTAKEIQIYFEACIEEAGEDLDFMGKVCERLHRARKLLGEREKDTGYQPSLG